MDPICQLDGNGYCARHKATHAGRMRELALAATAEGEQFRLYQDQVLTGGLWERLRSARPQPAPTPAATPAAPRPPRGPGTVLKALTSMIGVPPCQQCIDDAAWMDQLGVAGCRERLDEIVARVEPRAQRLGWFAAAAAAAAALRHGLPLTVRGMVEEAIRRAEANEAAAQAKAGA